MDKGRKTRFPTDHSNSVPITAFHIIDHDYNVKRLESVDEHVHHVARQEDVTDDLDDREWRIGRRVVELGTLADGLKACNLCGQPLHLSNCVGEKKFGLAQILQVKCHYPDCGLINDIPTGRKHSTVNGGQAWDVNTKLAAGM